LPSNVRSGRLNPRHRAWPRERRARRGGLSPLSHPAAPVQTALYRAPAAGHSSGLPRARAARRSGRKKGLAMLPPNTKRGLIGPSSNRKRRVGIGSRPQQPQPVWLG
jgi:hypothetical protein